MEITQEPKVIAIGGIGGGIGSQLAEQLHASGKQVVGFGRSADKLESVSAQASGIHTAQVDACDPDAVNAYFASIVEQFGRLDGYVHAIGSIYLKPAHLTSDADWAEVIQTNLNTAFFTLRAATKQMQRLGGGACVYFSSVAAQTGIANHEAIAAAKGGIEAMVRAAAATYAPRGIRINAIAPSMTDTPLAQPIIGSPQGLAMTQRMHPLGDIVSPDSVAKLANWLLSDNALSVTGQTFVIDGGLSSILPKPRA